MKAMDDKIKSIKNVTSYVKNKNAKFLKG